MSDAFGEALFGTGPKPSLMLVRHGRFLSPGARLKLRVHRIRTGNVLFADGLALLAYPVRIVTLPVAVIGDWLAVPVLRLLDRGYRPWWVVEVRFTGWDAQFVRLAELASKSEATARMASIKQGSRQVSD